MRLSVVSSSSSVAPGEGRRAAVLTRHEGVAQRLRQIRKLIPAAQPPRPREDPGDRLLDEVLRALARVAQRRRGPQEATEVRAEDLGIEPLQSRTGKGQPRPGRADGQRPSGACATELVPIAAAGAGVAAGAGLLCGDLVACGREREPGGAECGHALAGCFAGLLCP